MLSQLSKIERLLFSILSFKMKKIIGYSFDNFIQLAHHTLHKKEFTNTFLNSIESYYGLNKLLSEDKKGTLRNKLIEYKNNQIEQNAQYNEVISQIFPEAIKNEINLKDFV